MPILILCLLLLGPTLAEAYAPTFQASLEGHLVATPGAPPLETVGMVTFTPGKFGQAAELAAGAAVFYPTKGILDKAQGTVSFWIRPGWNGDDGQSHSLLADISDYHNRAHNTLYLWKDPRGLLRFEMRSPSGLDVNADVRGWRAGEWHHVAATWATGEGVALYLDGLCVGRNQTPYEPAIWPRWVLGGDWAGNPNGNVVFDEFTLWGRALEAGHVAALQQNLPLEDAAVTGLTAPRDIQPGVPFEVRLKVTAEQSLTRNYPVLLELEGVEIATFYVAPATKQWPKGQTVELAPVTVVLPEYLRTRQGNQKLTARLEGAVAPTGQLAATEVRVILGGPTAPGHVYEISELGVPVRDKRPFIPSGLNEGFLYEGRFYRDDEEGRMLACELIRTGNIQDALPCRLLDAVSCAATDHNFTEFGKSVVKETMPGVYCRITGPAAGVTEKVKVGEQEQAVLPGFSYVLKNTPQPLPHVLVAELPDDRERITELAIDAAPGSNLASHLATSGPGDTRLVSLATVYTGREHPCTGRIFRHSIIFFPKSNACQVTITNSGREVKPESDAGAAVQRLAVYQLLDTGPGVYNPVRLPETGPQRSVSLFLPEHSFLFSQYGFAGATPVQRRASLLAVCDYLKLMGINRLQFEPLGFDMNAHYGGSRLVNMSGYDLFDELLPLAEAEGLELVPVLDAMSYYDRLPEFDDQSFQLDKDGKTFRQAYGRVPDPLRPEVQAQFLGFVSEFLEKVRGRPGVPFIAFRVDGVAGTCFSGDAPNRPPQEAGFGEASLQAFATDTGLTLGGTPGDAPSRYAWLRQSPETWERWITWRCERTRDLWLKCRDLVVSRGDGRGLLVLTSLPSLAPGKYNYWQDPPTSPRDILRHHGYDSRMYTEEKGLRLSRAMALGAERYHGGEVNKSFYYQDGPKDLYRTAEGAETEFAFTYWDLPNHPRGHRVGPAGPAGRAFFEPLLHALRRTNPYNLTFSNWYPATLGRELDLRRFIRAYRALPAVEPSDFEGEIYPERSTLVGQWFGKDRLALINDSGEPRRVRLTFPKALPFGTRITDLATGQEVPQTLGKSKTRIEVSLEAWDLLALEVRELPASSTDKGRPGKAQP